MNIPLSLLKKISYFILLALSCLTAVSCDKEDALASQDNAGTAPAAVTIDANIHCWGSMTRSSYSGASENSGAVYFPMEFTAGDSIGVYAVDRDSRVRVANSKFVFDGKSWNAEEPVRYINGMGSYTYYAYYPYRRNLTDGYGIDGTTGYSGDVDDSLFFGRIMAAWTTAKDQSAIGNFTGSDLMTAKAGVTMPLFHQVHLTFTFRHRMGLLITRESLDYYDEDNPSDRWSVKQGFKDNVPYAVPGNANTGERYYIARPDTQVTLGEKTTSVGSGEVEYLYFPKGEPVSR